MPVSKIAELSNLSESYISQVKHGKRPPSEKLLKALANHVTIPKPQTDYLSLFLQSRQAIGVTAQTLRFYKDRLYRFALEVNYLKASDKDIERYLGSIPPNRHGLSTRHASFRAMRVFYRWLSAKYDLPNPMLGMIAPILSKPILPSLSLEQVLYLIDQVSSFRDKAIIALFVESGLRLSELTNIKPEHIDWSNRIIRVMGKGRKEAYAPFGEMSEGYLKAWLAEYQSNDSNIWGLTAWGIVSVFRRLKAETGLPCNPHIFRRTFACLLRKAGIDTMTIKDLGRW